MVAEHAVYQSETFNNSDNNYIELLSVYIHYRFKELAGSMCSLYNEYSCSLKERTGNLHSTCIHNQYFSKV